MPLSFGIEMHETEDDPGRGLVERLIQHQDASGLGKLVASGLIGETLLRNVVPFADIAVSSIGNWKLAKKVGQFTQRNYASAPPCRSGRPWKDSVGGARRASISCWKACGSSSSPTGD